MILFVFEGKRREPELYRTIEYLFFSKKETIICSFCNNIYALYQKMNASDFTEDILTILKNESTGKQNSHLRNIKNRDDIAEIFLFFDYDCHNQNKDQTVTLDELNNRLSKMLSFFNNETENGKLYINYPMVESIRYTKKLPDSSYNTYTIAVSTCTDFKHLADDFSDYGNLDFISFRITKKEELKIPSEAQIKTIKSNWEMLKTQNVIKADFICTGNATIPVDKNDINQDRLFHMQISKYVSSKKEIAILNSFPVFLFEYLK